MKDLMLLGLMVTCTYLGYNHYSKNKNTEQHPIAPPIWIDRNETPKEEIFYCDVTPQSPEKVLWNTDYYQAMEVCSENKIQCLILCSTDNCPPCIEMKKMISDSELSKQYDLVSLHTKKDSDLIKKLGVESYPCLVIVSPDYKITHKIFGKRDLQTIKNCLSKSTCYCCDNPMCECGPDCRCNKCDCTKEKTPQIQYTTQPQFQSQQQYIPQPQVNYYQPQYQQQTYQPSYQPIPTQNYTPSFGGNRMGFGGGGFLSGGFGGNFGGGGRGGC